MNNIKEDDFRQKLISLLTTDKEIQKIILTIIDENAVDSTEFLAENDKEQIADLKKLVEELQLTKRKQGEELAEAECQIAELHAECLELKKYCEHAETNGREQKEKIQALLVELESLQKTLKQRFDRGGEIYTRYQSCKAKMPLQVENVICREGFEAFIVGLAQPDALEQLWEAARDAVLQKHDDTEKKLLWDMFTYSLELINQTVAEPLYELETVEKGDAYDMERHTTVRGSRIQGNVTEVIFPGYRNLHTGRIEPTLIRI